MMNLKTEEVQTLVAQALEEDIGSGDLTAQLIAPEQFGRAQVLTREFMVIAGKAFVNEVFSQVDEELELNWHVEDGATVNPNTVLFTVAGRARSLLSAERTALNFLQFLSGTATTTWHWVKRLKGTNTLLLDTRKTIPLFRRAQKYAVLCGGGHNHRLGLYDAFLIKENHIMAAGSISNAIQAAKQLAPQAPVEIEIERLSQLEEAITAGADIVMLDNFNLDAMQEAVHLNQQRVKLEVSGGVNLDNIAIIAATGVDFISVGSLTKHVQAIDLSMRFVA